MNQQITNPEFEKIDKQNLLNWNERFDRASEILSTSTELINKYEEINYKKGVNYALLNKLTCEFLLSKHDENIIKKLYSIVEYFEPQKDEIGYVTSMNITANVLQSYGDFKNALEFCMKAQQRAQILKLNADLADNYSICGLIHSDLADYEVAINHFKKSLKIRQSIKNQKAIASSLNLIARNYSLSGDYSEALNFYNQALKLRTEMNDTGGLPWTLIGLASTYENMNDYVTAMQYYEKALELNEKHEHKRCKLHCYFGMGSVKSIISPSKVAEDYLLEAKKIADELNAKPIVYKIYKNLSELYERMLDIPKAFAYFKMYQSQKEKVINTQLQNQLKNKEIVYAIESSQKEAEIYRLKHVELKGMYAQLENKNKEITDSINYARNIQVALLPSKNYINTILPENFILFKPRNIVSGDFYWITKIGDNLIVVAADCTGHGVPGAFMSMLGISYLNEIVNKTEELRPDLILNELREMIITSLNKNNTEKGVSDGMDISLCLINTKTLKLQYAGAFNPLFIYTKNNNSFELIQIDGDRMPIGLYIKDKEPFLNKEFQLKKNDAIYMFSDGYPDQFGGPLEKKQKFMKKRFKQLLLDIQEETMQKQGEILDKNIIDWMGDNNHQTDDITIIGLKF